MLKAKWYYIFVGWSIAAALVFALGGLLGWAVLDTVLAAVCWFLGEERAELEKNERSPSNVR